MKAILISIKPKWVAKILNGEKTIEIRKTMPKCDLPIDVYIYCTKDNKGYLTEYLSKETNKHLFYSYDLGKLDGLNGKVVAKFTLNKVEWTARKHLPFACINEQEYRNYVKDGIGYAWHISNLEIFDEPKELYKFYKYGVDEWAKKHAGIGIGYLEFWNGIDDFRLTKAPQSWCYIKDLIYEN